MNNEKVYIDGYVVGLFADTLGIKGKQIQLANGDIVDIDDNFIHKSIEPEKVKVSEEEAKFLKTFNFRHESDVTKALYYVSRTGFCYYLTDGFDTELKGLSEGFQDLENRKRLIRAILFGYTVEKEPKYTVKVKGICGNYETLNRVKRSNKWLFSDREENSLYGTHHTRNQLEDAGFGWVFDCEGIEIEEVEG